MKTEFSDTSNSEAHSYHFNSCGNIFQPPGWMEAVRSMSSRPWKFHFWSQRLNWAWNQTQCHKPMPQVAIWVGNRQSVVMFVKDYAPFLLKQHKQTISNGVTVIFICLSASGSYSSTWDFASTLKSRWWRRSTARRSPKSSFWTSWIALRTPIHVRTSSQVALCHETIVCLFIFPLVLI